MKILLIHILSIFITISAVSQDTIRIVHKNYTTVFSKSKKYPVLVEWWVTKAKINCQNPVPRSNKFAPDPKLPQFTNLANDYKKSGFDRGHMSPSADNQCQTKKEQDESFYFSNMVPQYHKLNGGDWKTVEMQTRELSKTYDSVKVWSGSIGEVKKIGSVSVPEKCWKVIYVKKTKQWFAYVFPNSNTTSLGVDLYRTKKEYVEKMTGFKF